MYSFVTEQIWIISAPGWLFKKKSITMHGNMNVKFGFIHFDYFNELNLSGQNYVYSVVIRVLSKVF